MKPSRPDRSSIPYGYCECGCGKKTNLVRRNDTAKRLRRGEPRRFIVGHTYAKRAGRYRTENRGYKTPCWIWTALLSRDGYGLAKRGGHRIVAHRLIWEESGREIPGDGYELDHLCKQRSCVNPDHLEVVTILVNRRRASYCRMDENMVREMRRLRIGDDLTYAELAKRFHLSVAGVASIIQGRVWREVCP